MGKIGEQYYGVNTGRVELFIMLLPKLTADQWGVVAETWGGREVEEVSLGAWEQDPFVAQRAAWDATRVACLYTDCYGAWYAVRGAAIALAVCDLISEEVFNVLVAPVRNVNVFDTVFQ